jgi:hypothetical protein
MAADDHIRRTFDTLAERLRDEISRQLDEVSGPLAASLDGERADVDARLASALAEAADLKAALADANNRLAEALASADDRLAAALAEADARVAAAVRETEDRVADAVATAQSRHAEALAEADASHTAALAEADASHAAALAEADAHFAEAEARHAAALAKADRGETLAKADASERLSDAIHAMDRARSLSEILDTLAGSARREAARVSVLLVRGSQLRAWRFIGFGPKLDEATQYEIPVMDAGIIGDAVRSGAPVSRDGLSTGAHTSAPFFAELPPGRAAVALPVPMSGQVVAVLYADQGPGDDDNADDAADAADVAAPAVPSWPASLEVMVRHAARCLEAVTAYRSAQAHVKVLTDAPGDDEQAARRYARLLISEIKLYHEADVVTGRRERDLATRLGGEIARARALYEQRVPAHIRQSTDCFHDELVRTLADGDRGLIA